MWGRRKTAAWRGSIGCEGGPVIVANAEDFEHWTGSDPLDSLEPIELHVWGQFTAELPEAFRPDGPTGHQILPAGGRADVLRMQAELVEYVRERWPGTVVEDKFGTAVLRRPDGTQMNVRPEPLTEYDRCIRDLDDVKVHQFGARRNALVWSVEPGIVDLHRSADGRRLALAQVTVADDDAGAREALGVVDEVRVDPGASLLTWEIHSSAVVVAWAPNSITDLEGRLAWTHLAPKDPGRILDLATGSSGALLALEAGTYQVVTGFRDGGQWEVMWCILEPATPASSL
jgi:hypothetical protein